ncbi:MAG: peptidylprolyl isomerase [Myxococcota bacterium]
MNAVFIRLSELRIPLIMLLSIVSIAYGLIERDVPAPDVVAVVNGQPVTTQAVLDSVPGDPPAIVTRRWMDAALERAVVDELLFQQVHELGLVRRDAVLRGRVLQILREVAEEEAAMAPVTDAQLRDLYAEDPTRFTTSAVVRFEEIYVQESGAVVPERLVAARARVVGGAAFSAVRQKVGDPPPFAFPTDGTPIHVIRRRYGEAVARALLTTPVDTLSAPVRGPSGFHVVRVLARDDARPRPFEEVRSQLEADLRAQHRRLAVVRWIQQLREEAQVEHAPNARVVLLKAIGS